MEEKYLDSLHCFLIELRYIDDIQDTLNYIGCCCINLNMLFQAEQIFSNLCVLSPDWERPFFNLGRVYFHFSEYEKAKFYYEKALEINRFCEDTYFYYGNLMLNDKEYEKAIEMYNRAIEINKDSETLNNLGLCYLRTEKYEVAKEIFESALMIDENDYLVIQNLGIVNIYLKKYRLALQFFNKFKEKFSDDIKNNKDIAYCETKIDNFR